MNLKNQRQTVVESIAERNKNSLLGISKGANGTNLVGPAVSHNQSTLD
jgi:hypothetical protein